MIRRTDNIFKFKRWFLGKYGSNPKIMGFLFLSGYRLRAIHYLFMKLYFILIYYKVWKYWQQRKSQLLKLLTNTSILTSILLGAVSIFIALSRITYKDLSVKFNKNYSFNVLIGNIEMKVWVYLILLFVILFIGFLLLARIFFKQQPPKIYADHSVPGRFPSQVMVYISYCIWKECQYFKKYRYLIWAFRQMQNRGGNIDRTVKFKKKYRKKIKRFNASFNRRFHLVKEIDEMIILLGKSLRIPPYRISEYFFQFSPTIYLAETRLMFQRMYEIVILAEKDEDEVLRHRILENCDTISNLYDKIYKSQLYHATNVKFRDLHEVIINISKDFGLSSSIQAYILGIQGNLTDIGDKHTGKKIEKMQRIRYLFFKRRMHPGFDMHALVINLVEYYLASHPTADMSNKEIGRINKIKEGLEVFKHIESLEFEEKFDTFKPLGIELLGMYEDHRQTGRDEILKKFNKMVLDLIKEVHDSPTLKNLVFMTKGYSSLVTHTLQRLIIDLFKNDSKITKMIRVINMQIFILYDELEDKDHRVTVRHLRYRFKENPNLPLITNNTVHVNIGDFQWYCNNFEAETTKVVLLSGAEFVGSRAGDVSGIRPFPFIMLNDECLRPDFITKLHSRSRIRSMSQRKDGERTEIENVDDNFIHVVMAERFKLFKYPIGASEGERNPVDIDKVLSKDFPEGHFLYPCEKRTLITN